MSQYQQLKNADNYWYLPHSVRMKIEQLCKPMKSGRHRMRATNLLIRQYIKQLNLAKFEVYTSIFSILENKPNSFICVKKNSPLYITTSEIENYCLIHEIFH